MKLIKFIAAAALVASTSLVSDATETSTGATQSVAGVCYDWPFCREVEIFEETSTIQQLKAEVTRKTV